MARRKLIWEEVVFRKTSVQSLTYMESILHDRSGSNSKGYAQSKLILMSRAREIFMCSSVREKQNPRTCSKNSVRKGIQYGPNVAKIIHIIVDIESKMQIMWKFTKNKFPGYSATLILNKWNTVKYNIKFIRMMSEFLGL